KIYVTHLETYDSNKPIIFSKGIQEKYEQNRKADSEKKLLETGRKNCVTTIRMNNFKNLIDLTRMNEGEYIDIITSTDINEKLTKVATNYKDFNELLVKKVDCCIYG